jgi:hypothetical protein
LRIQKREPLTEERQAWLLAYGGRCPFLWRKADITFVLKRMGVMVFELEAHSRAFEDVTSVMGMVEQRLVAGQQLASSSDPNR